MRAPIPHVVYNALPFSTCHTRQPSQVPPALRNPPGFALLLPIIMPVVTPVLARGATRAMSSRPGARLSQLQRQFSSSRPAAKEIQDVYILSAARTPTAKVPIPEHSILL